MLSADCARRRMAPSCAPSAVSSKLMLVSAVGTVLIAILGILIGAHVSSTHAEWTALILTVETHVNRVHDELQGLFDAVCMPTKAMKLPDPASQTVGNVNVPSCSKIYEEFGPYYGNLNMLIVEAWFAKILPMLRHQASAWLLPHAALLQVHDELVNLDGRSSTMAGAIFVRQLWSSGWPSDAALMIGIHRMPRHKRGMRGRRGHAGPPVTETIIDRVKGWCNKHKLRRLFVCPYKEIQPRLMQRGFVAISADNSVADLSFGHLELAKVCEDGMLMVARPAER